VIEMLSRRAAETSGLTASTAAFDQPLFRA